MTNDFNSLDEERWFMLQIVRLLAYLLGKNQVCNHSARSVFFIEERFNSIESSRRVAASSTNPEEKKQWAELIDMYLFNAFASVKDGLPKLSDFENRIHYWYLTRGEEHLRCRDCGCYWQPAQRK